MTVEETLIKNKIPIVDSTEWGKYKIHAVKVEGGFIVWNFIKGFAIYIDKPETIKYVW